MIIKEKPLARKSNSFFLNLKKIELAGLVQSLKYWQMTSLWFQKITPMVLPFSTVVKIDMLNTCKMIKLFFFNFQIIYMY